jgi:hypothetical protein
VLTVTGQEEEEEETRTVSSSQQLFLFAAEEREGIGPAAAPLGRLLFSSDKGVRACFFFFFSFAFLDSPLYSLDSYQSASEFMTALVVGAVRDFDFFCRRSSTPPVKKTPWFL